MNVKEIPFSPLPGINGITRGVDFYSQQGLNLAVGALTDIWEVGGFMVYFDTNVTVQIVSTNVLDSDSFEFAAKKILVEGVDEDFNLVREEVAMNGTTPVVLTGPFMRINKLTVSEMGDSAAFVSNAGFITCVNQGTGDIMGVILPSFGESIMSHYTLPAGKTAFVHGLYVDTGPTAAPVAVQFAVRDRTSGSLSTRWSTTGVEGYVTRENMHHIRIEEKSDIVFRGITLPPTTPVFIQAGYSLTIIDNKRIATFEAHDHQSFLPL